VVELKKIRTDLEDLRSELMEYILDEEVAQDLTGHFAKVKLDNEAAYELIMLVVDEIRTNSSLNKSRTAKLIDKTISIKVKTLDKLIEDKAAVATKKSKSGPWWQKITWYDIWKGVGTAIVILIVLVSLYKVVPEAIQALTKDSVSIIEATQKK